MIDLLKSCTLCPNFCKANRLNGENGICGALEQVRVAKAFLHQWEEPCISGDIGSGTVFFSGCTMKCVFCQNYKISQEMHGRNISVTRLSEIFLELQNQGACNINLVSPTPYVLHITEAVALARKSGLCIPIIYNTNGYETIETINLLKGTIDIYLPDIKYFFNSTSTKYSLCENYFSFASQTILEMVKQVGFPEFDENGMLLKGVLIRHMLLPGMFEESKKLLKWVKENIGNKIYISLMCQYTPMYKAKNLDDLNKKIEEVEYEALIDYFFEIGLENGFVQENNSADESYVPDFDLSGI